MGNYFSEKVVAALVAQWQEANRAAVEKGVVPIPDMAPHLAAAIMAEVAKVCKGAIYTHGLHKLEPIEDVLSAAVEACWTALPRFDAARMSAKTGKPCTLFNYFSLTAWRAGMYYTKKQEAWRRVSSLDVVPSRRQPSHGDKAVLPAAEIQPPLDVEAFMGAVRRIVSRVEYPPRRKRMWNICGVLEAALRSSNGAPITRRALFAFAASQGGSAYNARAFLRLLKDNREDLM